MLPQHARPEPVSSRFPWAWAEPTLPAGKQETRAKLACHPRPAHRRPAHFPPHRSTAPLPYPLRARCARIEVSPPRPDDRTATTGDRRDAERAIVGALSGPRADGVSTRAALRG